ncbi:putative transferase CAF17 homolog, mitochondrial [Pieris napi]|uniref:putative transferase CAF17 homolog, mitochondrial n=1 Tax=Pieris napi TaxID=78633 RepID=UPI001FBAD9DF|nr:putative transferase CAF17 homolog, mitochondrial [Pieris napi]
MIYQVNKYFCQKSYVTKHFLKCMHHCIDPQRSILYPLKSKRLLLVTGNEASVFLQGLITNDMRHFEEGAKSVYAMFLNNKGRVLFDTLIHKWGNDQSYMLECDQKIVSSLEKHLKVFKLRRKVTIENIHSDHYKLWALITPKDKSIDENIDLKGEVNIYKDPRLSELGHRIISAINITESQVINSLCNNVTVDNNEDGYRYFRYKLGVSEGADDLPPGTSFPLEVNCDYLHGVSFHKGCYIGQEVTARVHHTGVVRKRIMSLKFAESVKEKIENDSIITASSNPKSNLGKLKGVADNYGLGLIRIKEALDVKSLKIGNYIAEAVKPDWWPIEAPKELQKSE